MERSFSSAIKLLTLTLAVLSTSCKDNTMLETSNNNNSSDISSSARVSGLVAADFQKLADKLALRMNGNCIGYSFVVSYQGQYKTNRAGGQSRTSQDLPSRPFTMYDKYDIASVSKTITATALIKKLNELPNGINVNLDMPMWTFLPSHWQMGVNIKKITFRQLLTHTSGLRYDPTPNSTKNGDDYQTLKNLMLAGVNSVDKVYSYNNRNFGLMRLLIPTLAKYTIYKPSDLPGFPLATVESIQATQFAEGYKDYCRQTIFNKLGTTATQTIECKNTDTNQGLCYVFPVNFKKGYAVVSDGTLTAGAQGWFLNTIQVNDFFTTLQYTETLLPKTLTTLMKTQLLGYDRAGTLSDGTTYYWKNGVYDFGAGGVAGSYRSLIIGFSDDIQITMMADSPINLQEAAKNAHQDWHP